MDSKQTLELVVIWQEVNDGLDRIQAILVGGEHNGTVQEIETIKEKLADIANRAVNGDGWQYIPIGGEPVPDAELNMHYTPEEEARINEYEMWGPQGRPRGPWL